MDSSTGVKEEDKVGKAARRPHLAEEKDYEALREIFRHHIDSFDHMLERGLDTMMQNVKPVEVLDPATKLKLRNILLIEL